MFSKCEDDRKNHKINFIKLLSLSLCFVIYFLFKNFQYITRRLYNLIPCPRSYLMKNCDLLFTENGEISKQNKNPLKH